MSFTNAVLIISEVGGLILVGIQIYRNLKEMEQEGIIQLKRQPC